MFKLQFGFVGSKERFVAKKYIIEEYKELGYETKLYIEKKHQNGVEGQFFDNIEELLNEEVSIAEYKNLDDFIENDCGSIGQIDLLIKDNVNEDKDSDDFTKDEIKKIVKKYYDSDIIEAFENLEKDEKLYILSSWDGEYFGTDKKYLILSNIFDGQYQRVYDNIDEIIEAIESNEEIATVYIYNYMSNYKKEKYLEEYENEN